MSLLEDTEGAFVDIDHPKRLYVGTVSDGSLISCVLYLLTCLRLLNWQKSYTRCYSSMQAGQRKDGHRKTLIGTWRLLHQPYKVSVLVWMASACGTTSCLLSCFVKANAGLSCSCSLCEPDTQGCLHMTSGDLRRCSQKRGVFDIFGFVWSSPLSHDVGKPIVEGLTAKPRASITSSQQHETGNSTGM